MCQPGQQLDPRYGCDCIPQTQYNAIMANCDTPYCDDGYYWSTDACMCFAEIQCAMMCIPGLQLDPRSGCHCIPQAQYDAIMDNCNNNSAGGYYIDISFDIDTGVFIFNTDNTSMFPAGTYYFQVIIIVGEL
jgi:hypothetical protein